MASRHPSSLSFTSTHSVKNNPAYLLPVARPRLSSGTASVLIRILATVVRAQALRATRAGADTDTGAGRARGAGNGARARSIMPCSPVHKLVGAPFNEVCELGLALSHHLVAIHLPGAGEGPRTSGRAGAARWARRAGVGHAAHRQRPGTWIACFSASSYGTYHFDSRVLPCLFCSSINRICNRGHRHQARPGQVCGRRAPPRTATRQAANGAQLPSPRTRWRRPPAGSRHPRASPGPHSASGAEQLAQSSESTNVHEPKNRSAKAAERQAGRAGCCCPRVRSWPRASGTSDPTASAARWSTTSRASAAPARRLGESRALGSSGPQQRGAGGREGWRKTPDNQELRCIGAGGRQSVRRLDLTGRCPRCRPFVQEFCDPGLSVNPWAHW